MLRQGFQIQHLRACAMQGVQQPGLAGARGTAYHLKLQGVCAGLHVLQHRRPEGFVAAFHQVHPKADLIQYQRQRAAAFAPAPAVEQGAPIAGFVYDFAFNVGGNIARSQRRAALFGFEGVDLLVRRADELALGIIQGRPVTRAGEMVFGKFGFAARVNHGVESIQVVHRICGGNQGQAHGSSRFNPVQTLLSKIGCAAAVG